jgi:hypothetical protein
MSDQVNDFGLERYAAKVEERGGSFEVTEHGPLTKWSIMPPSRKSGDISEPPVYAWTDSQGNLIGVKTDISDTHTKVSLPQELFLLNYDLFPTGFDLSAVAMPKPDSTFLSPKETPGKLVPELYALLNLNMTGRNFDPSEWKLTAAYRSKGADKTVQLSYLYQNSNAQRLLFNPIRILGGIPVTTMPFTHPTEGYEIERRKTEEQDSTVVRKNVDGIVHEIGLPSLVNGEDYGRITAALHSDKDWLNLPQAEGMPLTLRVIPEAPTSLEGLM